MLYGGIVLALVLMMRAVPGSFLPEEDQGVLFVLAQAPAGASQERMNETLKTVEEHFLTAEKDTVAGIFTVAGFSFAGRGQSGGLAFVNLKDWSQRQRPDQKVLAIAGKAMGAFSRIKDALVFAFPPPAVLELGNASGFDFQLQDQGGLGHEALMQARNQLLGQAARHPALAMVRPNGMEDTPQLRVTVDREKAGALGLSLADINTTLSATWGSVYVNDFIESGRVKKVMLQADAPFRMQPNDLDRLQVRNNAGEMVPFSTFSSTAWSYGSPQLERYNGIPSRDIMGSPSPGHSSGQAMAAMEEIARTLPPGIGSALSGAHDSAAAAIRSRYANMGMAGSSAEMQDLNNLAQTTVSQGADIANKLLATGVSEQQFASGLYQNLMATSMAQDTNMSNAISSFTGALARSSVQPKPV